MKQKLVLLCAGLGLFVLGCNANLTAPVNDTPNGMIKIEESLRFKGVRPIVRPPCQIQFLFSLRDTRNQIMTFEPSELASRISIFENDSEIDYAETNFFLSTAQNFRQDIVLVLDFTNSVLSLGDNHSSSIEHIVAAGKKMIRSLGPIHRMALIEFHDRHLEPQILSDFTADTTALLARLNAFASFPSDYGASRAWDAIQKGIELFPSAEQPDTLRLLFFLSDGSDTSSRYKPKEIIDLAQEKLVQIYCVGIGSGQDGETLQSIGNATEGHYFAVESLSEIDTEMEAISKSLGSHYKLSYISLQQQPQLAVRVQLEHDGKRNSFSQNLDLSAISAAGKDDRIGRLTYDATAMHDRAQVILRLEHTPRNINMLKFQLQTDLLQQIRILPQAQGGLLDQSWRLTLENDGWFVLQSPASALPFGAFGLLVKAEIAPLSNACLNIPFAIDNAIYSGGKAFTAPDTLRLGAPNCSAGKNLSFGQGWPTGR